MSLHGAGPPLAIINFVGEASLFFIGMHVIKTKGKRLVQSIYA